jgi:hypothetical protein
VSPDSVALWAEVEALVKRQVGVRVVEGTATLPCDLRLYEKVQDGLSKHEQFRAMIHTAKAPSSRPGGWASRAGTAGWTT